MLCNWNILCEVLTRDSVWLHHPRFQRKSNKILNNIEIVFLCNRIIKNILLNYIPYEIIICDDWDPPWINNRIKELINDTFQCYLHSNNGPKLVNKVKLLHNELKSLIEANK